MLRAMLLSRLKPPQARAEGQPLQGHRSQRQLSTKVSGPPLPPPQPLAVGPNQPPRPAKFTHSKFKRAKPSGRRYCGAARCANNKHEYDICTGGGKDTGFFDIVSRSIKPLAEGGR